MRSLRCVGNVKRSVTVKANEFVRVFGLDITKIAINECPPEYDLDTVELKRLVESHELVESWGGLDDAKFALQLVRYPERLNQAILDVESCQ